MESFVIFISMTLFLAVVTISVFRRGKQRVKSKSNIMGSSGSHEKNRATSVMPFGSFKPKYSRSCSDDHEIKLSVLQEQMLSALHKFETSEDFQALWIAVEADLRDLDESGTVPETEIDSAGLDRNNYDHLCRAFEDIENQFKEQRFEFALSRIKACRSVFIYSDIYRIQNIFMEDNFIILKMLFFKSYVD